jgi:membrane-bound lytic murein transglycosylase A
MAAHPNEARDLLWENRSFVFFREVEPVDLKLGPPGAQQVPLSPGRSLAIDRSLWAYGTPVWLDTKVPTRGGDQLFRQLLIAQDTGSAILGHARGDVFFGAGEDAAWSAGHMKSMGRMIVFLPRSLAQRLMASQ